MGGRLCCGLGVLIRSKEERFWSRGPNDINSHVILVIRASCPRTLRRRSGGVDTRQLLIRYI